MHAPSLPLVLPSHSSASAARSYHAIHAHACQLLPLLSALTTKPRMVIPPGTRTRAAEHLHIPHRSPCGSGPPTGRLPDGFRTLRSGSRPPGGREVDDFRTWEGPENLRVGRLGFQIRPCSTQQFHIRQVVNPRVSASSDRPGPAMSHTTEGWKAWWGGGAAPYACPPLTPLDRCACNILYSLAFSRSTQLSATVYNRPS